MSDIYLSLTETPSVVTLSQPVVSGVLSSTVTVANTVTVALDANSLSALENVTVTVGAAVSVSNFPSTQTIAGTVTANVGFSSNVGEAIPEQAVLIAYNTNNFMEAVGENTPLPISGTVTANGGDFAVSPFGQQPPSKLVAVGGYDAANDEIRLIPLSEGADRVRVEAFIVNGQNSAPVTAGNPFQISGTVTVGNPVTIYSLPAISGTVTAAAPNGSLTTRFGTPTTASVAFATSCVTNANRKYLLIQNVTTGSNVITVGIGFTPTTTQGIQLTAGAGITFESSYIPTGAVYVLSSVTASNFTILEA